jgi:hypothetical protein
MAGQDHILSKGFLATGSAAYVFGQLVVPVAGTVLDPNQMNIAGTTWAAGALPPLGLVQENLDLVKVQTGKAYASVAFAGLAFGIAFGAIAVGAVVVPDTTTGGRLKTPTVALSATFQGLPAVGIAMTAATTAGDIFSVFLTPGMRY